MQVEICMQKNPEKNVNAVKKKKASYVLIVQPAQI